MEQAHHSQYFHVEGVRCARCIHAIESALKSHSEVAIARVNLSTKRLLIEWNGDAENASTYAQEVTSLGYRATPFLPHTTSQEKSEQRNLLHCMAISGFAMGNIMLISAALWSSEQDVMGLATRDLLHWLSALIALPTITWAGRPFFFSALSVLKNGRTNMDVPISLALILACAMSLFETIHHGKHAYFDSAVMLLFFLLIGRWLDARARGKARENAQSLLAMMQGYATIIDNGKARNIPINELREGMELRIAAGETIPTDCKIITGTSELDTSLVTGETVPRQITSGEIAYGGMVNLSTPLTCHVLKSSENSLLADIIRLMEKAEQGRARYVRLADKAAQLYTPVVHSLAALAFLGWYFGGGASWQEALLIAITTLIITCPCALGLAVPVVQVLASSWLMKRGILLKSGDALERLAKINHAVFDKTGTLTMGKPVLVQRTGKDSRAERGKTLKLAASLAQHSKHPYSQAIVAAYDGELLPMSNVREVPGMGVYGHYDNVQYHLGRSDEKMKSVALYESENAIQHFTFEDEMRPNAAETIAAFHNAGIQTHLLSGDHDEAVSSVADTLGIPHAASTLLPEEKTHIIQALQKKGKDVLMVGDGLNDAPSLAQANISISPSSGMDITQNTADIVFQNDSLLSVTRSWHMAKFSTKLVKQNFALAVAYNCIAIPIALAGMVTPMIAAIAMSGSSLIVIANSFRINHMKEM